jgi:hypothetical protein
MKTYKQEIIENAISGLKDGGYPFPESLIPLFTLIYQSGYNECIRNIKEKNVSGYSDRYSDIISDGGMDPR